MGRCIVWEPSDMAKEGMTSPGDSHTDMILNAGGLRDCCVSDEIRPPDAKIAWLTPEAGRLGAFVCHQLGVSMFLSRRVERGGHRS